MQNTMRLATEARLRSLPKKINFTVTALSAAVCPLGKPRTWLYDLRTPGLAMMVTSSSAKSFYSYRKINGRPVRVCLGRFPGISIEQARKLAGKVIAEIAQGVDPMEHRRKIRRSITLQELFDSYTKNHAEPRGTPRTLATNKSRFDTCFNDWKSRKIATITGKELRDKHAEIGRRGHVTANRAMQLLRGMFSWEKIEPNPIRKGVIAWFKEHERERFLEAGELARFFAALEKETNAAMRDYILMSLYTGGRRSNVLSMRWDEINLAASTWTVPAGKSKSGEAMKIHLAAPAITILKARQNNGSEFVFPGPGKSGHLEEPKAAWKRILTAAKISDLHIHDLRRSLGSWMAAGGSSLQIIGKQLGHHDVATTKIYSRLNLDPVRQGVDSAVAAMVQAGKVEE